MTASDDISQINSGLSSTAIPKADSSLLPPLSLYIHIPWCVRKCPYCDFNSHQTPNSSSNNSSSPTIPEDAYVAALLNDLQQDLVWVQGREIQSIFIGGGTPSLMSAVAYDTLFSGLKQQLTFAADIEITLEANPGSFESEKFAGYRDAGINRLSLGIQSFNPAHLQVLGRIHDKQQAEYAISQAQRVGFDRFNIDLMYGLPGQSVEQALSDLRQALQFNPPHLSWYQLTIEPNTEFYKHPPLTPDDDALWDIQEAGLDLLAKHGYQQYEVSAHCQLSNDARQNTDSAAGPARHNINYWTFGDYLGIGAGAHGKITRVDQHNSLDVFRTQKSRMPEHYLQHFGPNSLASSGRKLQPIAAQDRPFEYLMNALRLFQPLDLDQLTARTGQTIDDVRPALEQAQQLKLIAWQGQQIITTDHGRAHLNSLLALFLDD